MAARNLFWVLGFYTICATVASACGAFCRSASAAPIHFTVASGSMRRSRYWGGGEGRSWQCRRQAGWQAVNERATNEYCKHTSKKMKEQRKSTARARRKRQAPARNAAKHQPAMQPSEREHVREHAHTHARTHTHTRARAQTHTHTHVCSHTLTHTHTRTRTHT